MRVASVRDLRLGRVAALVDQLALGMEPERLSRTQATAACGQIAELAGLLDTLGGEGAARLARSLEHLAARLAEPETRKRPRRADAARERRLFSNLRRIALILGAAGALAMPMAAAAQAVGSTIVHPVTGANVTVIAQVTNGVIVTGNQYILNSIGIGTVLPLPSNPAVHLPVKSQVVENGRVVAVILSDNTRIDRVTNLTSAPGAPAGGNVVVPSAPGNSAVVREIERGGGGGGGRVGALFVPATGGGAGGGGPSFSETVALSHGNISTTASEQPAVIIASIGGDGGRGGDGYLGAAGEAGGRGGDGGDVTATVEKIQIVTQGNGSHGVVVQSRAGVGGAGGGGYGFSPAGNGGSGSNGGAATVSNYASIFTGGRGAHGVFAQSLGGGAGGGGSSYGLFGAGGAGNAGGNGGSATAINYGLIRTAGENAYGVSAQSIGGVGGDAGNAVGLVSFTQGAKGGGNGGAATVEARTGSDIRTAGTAAYGLFAQSVGGGGGSGGLNIGLIALGASGGAGGDGGAANVTAYDRTFITTEGLSAHGIFAQSIGGGGGNGGIDIGGLAMGSSGASGGIGRDVSVNSGAVITTGAVDILGNMRGNDARGIFAQSVGGGGGTAIGSFGLVALGGTGAGAGGAGRVTVNTTSASSITTHGRGADGIFAQSVGGGGGAGPSAGGLGALGGAAGSGGAGGEVTINNAGAISTAGDFARGAFAQSVGGGGGAGGASGGLLTLGGTGAAASSGGAVTLSNSGTVSTGGNMASALQAQSIGGGGGDGGSTGGVFLTIGGTGASGGAAGGVTLNNAGNLSTRGNDSNGVFAQAVGGGGGNGGAAASLSAFVGVAIGGNGSTGGEGGDVNVNLGQRTVSVGGVPTLVDAVISTSGERSHGVLAQSVGGGGGNGGFAANITGGYGVGASIAIGGNGGAGSEGGDVRLNGDTTILTSGDYSNGLFAQSVGGGGGSGGFAVSAAFSGAETVSGAFALSLGGRGAGGGAGGTVDITSGGFIQTEGDYATGFLTQSVGGGGGNGGFSVALSGTGSGGISGAVSVGLGGQGAGGGAGGSTTGIFDGQILTTGHDSGAALIQSVGGGGGNGGFNVAGSVAVTSGAAGTATVGLGGSGAGGGDGGLVLGRVGGAVETTGERSTGVTVQSVGGGGGNGGFNVVGGLAAGGGAAGAVAVGLGGTGAGGGAGGDVTGSSGSTILTTGEQSGGLLVQSVGGGGGSGGFNVAGSIGGSGSFGAGLSVGLGGAGGGGGRGGNVNGSAEGAVRTEGDQANAVTVQSVGGGGGSGGFDISGTIGASSGVGAGLAVSVGGSGGGGGAGGDVIASARDVQTAGDQSNAFLAQSVGGGGGNGGFSVAGVIGAGGAAGLGVAVGVGGSGGGGGAGGNVTATVDGDAWTIGDDANGVIAQSIGGGGGNGGFAVSGGITGGAASGTVAVGVGGSGGLGGGAGAVDLAFTGLADTTGDRSRAILAQSVGGGGGNGGFAISGSISGALGAAGNIGVGVGGWGGGGGDAGSVKLAVNEGVGDALDALIAAVTRGDDAGAITAQSIGGGGGNGGFTVIGSISGADGAAGNIGVGVGGGGGDGGDGSTVQADVNGDVATTGKNSGGILAQSVGGGGGNGGFTVQGGISGALEGAAGQISVGVGGYGGGGGAGGAVSGDVFSDVTTTGANANAIHYQSIGGGGGNASFAVSGGITASAAASGTASVGVGGSGGLGGAAGSVDLGVTGTTLTEGKESLGILAQSIGGGGGGGSFAVSGSFAASGGAAGTIGIAVGGTGGGGGDGGIVTLAVNEGVGDALDALIAAVTKGDGARAITAQSIGGGGGNGGFSVSGGISGSVAAGDVGIGVGGGGGLGGGGGTVVADVNGDVVTSGKNASGILAQSVGGGGGNGGFSVAGALTASESASGQVMVGVGGFGGGGGDGGAVSGDVFSDVTTTGADSNAITYQSLGGGGGNGGFSVAGGISASGGAAGAISVGVGGFGGDGGNAGAVDLAVLGQTQTTGANSRGILAQSVGGGGGNGAFTVGGALAASGGGAGTIGVGVGGFAGGGGDAGDVALTVNDGVADALGALIAAVTTGDKANAIAAQSIGGGGGNGGFSVTAGISATDGAAGNIGVGVGGGGGDGGSSANVIADVNGDVRTAGKGARGVIAQSVGGGGGAGGFTVAGGIAASSGAAGNLMVGVGGFGGGGGSAGDVSGVVTSDVLTTGDDAQALTYQSIGGGGGQGGFAVSGALTLSGGAAGSVGMGVGGFGGDGGDAGDVSLDLAGTTYTRGGGSGGVLAQSVGGGGGDGGFVVNGAAVVSSGGAGTIGLSVGGFGGGGGNAGDVDLAITGNLNTNGVQVAAVTEREDAPAIIAQSLGGGGGNGGFAITAGASFSEAAAGNIGVGIGGGGGGGGNGADVIANVTGVLTTLGDRSGAILAQSVGGGGGNGGFNIAGGLSGSMAANGNLMIGVGGFGGAGGDAGSVSGVVAGDIFTRGKSAYGASYQSIGGGGGNGGFNVSGGIAVAVGSGGAGNLGIGVGGFGGFGGDAGNASLIYTGNVETQTEQTVTAFEQAAHGLLVQSLGGGGGNGGFNVTGGIAASTAAAGVLGLGVGGFGGGGGDAGDVRGVLTGDVLTHSDRAFGAMLASQGGGGGNGGLNVTGAVTLALKNDVAAAIGLGLGGFGGGGGDAGNVDGVVTGQYETQGDSAAGVIAQSLGGAGGSGGVNVTGTVGITVGNGTGATGGVGIGGFGGAGGDAGDVSLVRTGDTKTDGKNSHGVVAQSVGGGGGMGGVNVTGGLSVSVSGDAASVGIGIGGFGGGGGDAGDVTATVTGNVYATGSGDVEHVDAFKMPVNIPDAIIGIAEQIVDFPINVEERPAYDKINDGSFGVLAQSVGGGGGNGGINVTGQLSFTKPGQSASSRVAAIGLGGFGGDGGDAGKVDLTVRAPGADRIQIHSQGDLRSAAAAQSIGGGGGTGGINVAGGLAMDGVLVAGVGGFGGDGGLGSTVLANVNADLWAKGWQANGFLAQSVGGGGGAGGMNFTGGVSADPDASEPSITFGVGGFGGAGNAAGNVNAVQRGQIVVEGYQSHGVLAQSVGGGGGSGGLNVTADVSLGRASDGRTHGVAVAIGVGGTGGDGANAGDVALDSVGDIFMNAVATNDPNEPWKVADLGADGVGILAQSVGGGGGVGGINVSGAVSPKGSPIAVGIGGTGGSGGDAGTVSVSRGYETVAGVDTAVGGVIRTMGDNGDGLVAQSIGGGGGRAGVNLVLALTAKAEPDDNASAAIIAVGGGGSGAGSADDVDVRHAGTILTSGDYADGLVAQSIGGGGGDANFNLGFGVLKNANALTFALGGATGAAGTGADVTVEHDGVIITKGEDSMGVLAQSVGGGGGNAGMDVVIGILSKNSVAVTLGRHGGTGGESGDVSVDVDGLIDTTGDRSTAVLAQSIGGGGGNSGSRSVGASTTQNAGTPDAASYGGSIAVGLDGGVGAISGDVQVTAAGDIVTRGDDARGIHAQSIGGGGGAGGAAGNFVFRAAGSMNIGVGGDGGVGAASGEVDVTNAATIATLGDRADGILAQSIGGGGGLAGSARTIALQVGGVPKDTTTGTMSVNVGGTGGTGATGDHVSVTNSGVIATEGVSSFGIRAQSIGGGGGVGGAAVNLRVQGPNQNMAADVNLGGSGGTGGAAGAVDVVNEGLIVTEGRLASGISANSIGGGGGDAGIVMDVVVGATKDNKSQRAVLNVGGSGGAGGTGGDVTVNNRDNGSENSGVIVTKGDEAHGIFAQSLGGGGGNGSTVLSVLGMKSGENSVNAGLSVGGTGGDGDAAGDVRVDNTGVIDTAGAGSHGILAQSIGGGGGNGGLAIQGGLFVKSQNSNTPMITVGGRGGDGADAGSVIVDNAGDIVTRGANAHGIVAQSVGGGGGNAQLGISLGTDNALAGISNTISALVGGLGGGTGGLGGDVTVIHSGDITVLGDGSVGIKAESINGGGGSLTMDLSGITGLPGIPFVDIHGKTVTADPVVAARGGAFDTRGQSGGKVTQTTTGTTLVGGAGGAGAFNQSVGGGGGSIQITAELASQLAAASPSAKASILALLDAAPVSFEATLGGVKGVGNTGGDIASDHTGDIGTTGTNAPGSLIQSVGGGGGRAVLDITAPASAPVGTVTLALGGENGQGESGGNVQRGQAGALQTVGDLSAGAILQSVGGGGGSGSVVLSGQGALGALIEASLGAAGGSALDGGDVSGDFTGGVTTVGDSAPALLVQSIGAGGGEVRLLGAGAVNLALGGTAGASGDGGALDLVNNGAVVTTGDGSHAVMLQSIGGGGGAVFGKTGAVSLTLKAGGAGDGGDIAFVQSGDVVTAGAGAHGVMAQSIGGGGGFVDGRFAGSAGGAGAGGDIDLAINGQVFTAGKDSVAIWAQSLGKTGAGDIAIAVDGVVRGGSGSGAGVAIDGGAANTVTASGSISAVSGMAIRSGDGNETVTNTGLVVSNIDLGAGDNTFINRSGATFLANSVIDLRDAPTATGRFVNEGRFLMGLDASRYPLDLLNGATFADLDKDGDPRTNLMFGQRVINQVALDGDFVQTASGAMRFDLAFGPYASDRVNVTGDATVAGKGDVTLTWLQDAVPLPLFTTGGKGVDNGLAITDTLALDYSITGNDDGVFLSYVSNFGQPFLNRNQRALGGSIDSALTLGGSAGIGRLAAWLGNMQAGEEATYAAVFHELDPQPHLAPLHMQFDSAQAVGDSVFSCTTAVVGDRCAWFQASTSETKQEADFETFGFWANGSHLRGGYEQPGVYGPWSLAVTLAYDDLKQTVSEDNRSVSSGEAVGLGVGLRRTLTNGLEVGGSVATGWQSVDTRRRIVLFDPLVASSEAESGYLQLGGHMAYLAERGLFFARPAVKASVTALHAGGFEETGAAGLGVQRLSDTQVIGALSPELELGLKSSQLSRFTSSFSVTVGGVVRTEDALDSSFRFVGGNPDATPAVVTSAMNREAVKVGLSLKMTLDKRFTADIGYTAEFGDKTETQGAGVNLRWRF